MMNFIENGIIVGILGQVPAGATQLVLMLLVSYHALFCHKLHRKSCFSTFCKHFWGPTLISIKVVLEFKLIFKT